MAAEFQRTYLSTEDLELKKMALEERLEYYTFWLKLAQTTNDADRTFYSHGVFTKEPEPD